MSFQQAPSKKPRLSLQIKTACNPVTKSSRSYAIDPKDPTAYNTLSNVYATAIERAAPPVQSEPLTAINTLQAFSLVTPVEYQDPKARVMTPYVASYPETPVSETATSPRLLEMQYPSTMTATPPLSAGAVDASASKPFSFSPADISGHADSVAFNLQSDARVASRQQRLAVFGLHAPYEHPRSLHSILRNSPLPPATAFVPQSPRRQSLRLQEKANKRVGYNSPLTQEIVTNKYVKSHIDLLVEEASPRSPPCAPPRPENVLDLALAFTANEIQDGGQTPGPFEDMRRRMAGLGNSTPLSPSGPRGILKRRKKEKKRRWVWTIGQDEEDDDSIGGSIAALRAEAKGFEADEIQTPLTAIQIPHITLLTTPTPSIESTESGSECQDVDMSDTSSCLSVPEDRGLTPIDMDLDLKLCIAPPQNESISKEGDRDTPVPPELLEVNNGNMPVVTNYIMPRVTH